MRLPNPFRGWWRLPVAMLAAASVSALQEPSAVSALTQGAVVNRSLAGGQAHSYRLALAAGEYATLAVEQRGIDVVAQVLDPAGKVVAEFDSEARKQGTEPVGVVADPAAAWELRVRAKYPRDPAGGYGVRVLAIHSATDNERSAFEARKLAMEAQQRTDAGKYDDAIQLFTRAVEAQEKAGNAEDPYIATLLRRLGVLQRRRSEYAKAEQSMQRAVAISQKALGRQDPQTAECLGGLGLLYTFTGEYAKAELLLEERRATIEKTLGGDSPFMVAALGDLAVLHQYRGDLQRALGERRRALDIAEKTLSADDYQLMAAVGNLGDLYSLTGDNARAEPMLERSLAMAESLYGHDHPYVAIALQNLGVIARETKRYDRALAYLWRAETIREKAFGPRHPDIATLLINIANLYHAQRQFSKALELQERAMDMLTAALGPYHRLTLMALSDAGRDYAAEGDLARAIQYQVRYAGAMDKDIALHLAIGSEREKLIYLNATSDFIDKTVSLYIRDAPQDKTARELAAEALLQHKGRVLDAMSGSLAALRERLNAGDRRLLDELSETNSRLANLVLGGRGKTPADEYQKQMAALEEQREKLEAAVSRSSAEFRAQSQPVTVAAVRAAIPPEAALIEFALYRPFDVKGENEEESFGEPHYVAYVLRREGEVKWAELGRAAAIDDAVSALRQALRDAHRRDVRELARGVDGKVFQPLRPLLGSATRLLISPDGSLNLIPFEALVDERGRYQVERYAISYLTAGRDLLRLQVTRASRSGPLVVADPSFGEPAVVPGGLAGAPVLTASARRRSVTTGPDLSSVYFAPLAGTAEEARGIQVLFPNAAVLTGNRATKISLQYADAPSILHIATHGFFLQDAGGAAAQGTRAIQANVKIENPLLRSGLALAGANLNPGRGDDGILTALEASTLNLWGTRVVTLSACETGVGEVKNGEGVYGLRRAFFLAGAETLVMSLWPVSDRVTRQTMIGYYRGLKNGLGRGEALRRAQLAMLQSKDRNHPFYWAGFIESGEWKNLDGK